MREQPFQAIIFDLGGVIVSHDNPVLFERLAQRCDRSWTAERVGALCRQGRWGTGDAIATLHKQLVDEAGYSASWPIFVDDWCCHLRLDQSMFALVDRLANTNRVLIFSNTNKEHWEFIEKLSGGAISRFEAYLSYEIGYEKPSVCAFQIVADKAGVEPGRCIFFDDLLANVLGAREAGFQAEVFEGLERLVSLLVERGVDLSSVAASFAEPS